MLKFTFRGTTAGAVPFAYLVSKFTRYVSFYSDCSLTPSRTLRSFPLHWKQENTRLAISTLNLRPFSWSWSCHGLRSVLTLNLAYSDSKSAGLDYNTVLLCTSRNGMGEQDTLNYLSVVREVMHCSCSL